MANVAAQTLDGALTLAALAVCLAALYLVFLAVAAVACRRRVPPAGPGMRRFALLVPAHDEALTIERLLGSLAGLDYTRERWVAHVVADNCADETAEVVRRFAASHPGVDLRVHERFDEGLKAKGYALAWLLERLRAGEERYDAYVVLDADSVVSANFLAAMDARLEQGSRVVQAYYTVLNAGESALAALRYAALAAIHYARPLGRAALGLSCGLKGNGMCFAAEVLEGRGWTAHGLAEDVELHLALVAEGLRVDFAPEATVLADMPVSFRQAAAQNRRWERGRVDVLRGVVPRLLLRGVVGRSPVRLDAALEQLIPPISVPVALGGLLALTG
ncbi:MAG TPA: glycosyltransferase family 2 protein, partial [Chloroflexota bacterium]|nr:glycosyltransferase family 2 protein [Chloroflexota bacterium]